MEKQQHGAEREESRGMEDKGGKLKDKERKWKIEWDEKRNDREEKDKE